MVTCAVAVVTGTAGIALEILCWYRGSLTGSIGVDMALTPVLAIAVLLGWRIVRQRPGNPIGWIFVLFSLLAGVTIFADGYATYGLIADPGSLPHADAFAWVTNWLWVPLLFSVLALLPLVFPDGNLLTRRWRWALRLVLCQIVMLSVGIAFAPGKLEDYDIPNPFAVDTPGNVFGVLSGIGFILIFVCLPLVAASIVLRFRRSHGLERLQVKWLAAGAVGVAIAFFASLFLDAFVGEDVWGFTVPVALTIVVLATGVAVLRYRLYEIDRIVNRTVVYGVVTALLAGLYFGIVLALQPVFSGFTRGNDLAIAGSTLAVAALFRPPAGASRRSSTAASTAAATTPSRRSTRSATASATRSTSTPSAPISARSSRRRCSRRTSRSGSAGRKTSGERPHRLVAVRALGARRRRRRSRCGRSLARSRSPAVLEGADVGAIVAFLVYAAVGSLIVSRRFGNRVGWIFLAMGLLFEIGLLAQEYAVYALRWSPGSLPGGEWAGLLADFLPVVAFGLGTFAAAHLSDRPPALARWLAVGWLSACSLFVILLATALQPGTLSSVRGVAKPVEVDFPLFTSGGWAWPGVLLAGLLAIISVILRYRRGDPVERQQLRWFLAAVPIFVMAIFWVPDSNLLVSLITLGIASLPIACGIAIFRYHLYDLGLVVRRTLVYGVLTAGLAGLYFGIVLGLQAVVQRLHSRQRSRHRRLDAGRRCPLPPGAALDPGVRRPALLSPPLRRRADARRLQLSAP